VVGAASVNPPSSHITLSRARDKFQLDSRDLHATSFIYVWIDVTGRRETQIPGTDETGVRMKIYFELGTEDQVTGTGWIVRAGTN
jgi:hypothetical protein